MNDQTTISARKSVSRIYFIVAVQVLFERFRPMDEEHCSRLVVIG